MANTQTFQCNRFIHGNDSMHLLILLLQLLFHGLQLSDETLLQVSDIWCPCNPMCNCIENRRLLWRVFWPIRCKICLLSSKCIIHAFVCARQVETDLQPVALVHLVVVSGYTPSHHCELLTNDLLGHIRKHRTPLQMAVERYKLECGLAPLLHAAPQVWAQGLSSLRIKLVLV